MITANSKTLGRDVKIDGVVNIGGWFGKRWILGIGCGYSTFMYLVEAGSLQDAIDEFVDSKHGHMVMLSPTTVEEREAEGQEIDRAGNYGDAVDLTDLRIAEEVDKVNFFAKKDSLDE
jgi:hypothetical protein